LCFGFRMGERRRKQLGDRGPKGGRKGVAQVLGSPLAKKPGETQKARCLRRAVSQKGGGKGSSIAYPKHFSKRGFVRLFAGKGGGGFFLDCCGLKKKVFFLKSARRGLVNRDGDPARGRPIGTGKGRTPFPRFRVEAKKPFFSRGQERYAKKIRKAFGLFV